MDDGKTKGEINSVEAESADGQENRDEENASGIKGDRVCY